MTDLQLIFKKYYHERKGDYCYPFWRMKLIVPQTDFQTFKLYVNQIESDLKREIIMEELNGI